MRTKKKLIICVIAFLFLLISSPMMASALPDCASLPSLQPLAGNPAVVTVTASELTTTGGRAYCMVKVLWSTLGESGPAEGYAPGESQSINIGIALPLNTNTGDAAWGGRLIMTAGGGAQGSVPNLTGMIGMSPAAIGAGTDSGHTSAQSNTFGVIQATHTLDYGKIEDWAGGESNGIAVKLAKRLARTYYGNHVRYTYWNGCSGGGHMGWAQVQNYPEEYDGALIGAPAFYWQEFRLTDSWDEIVRKKVAQQTAAITQGQMDAANAAATAACAAVDGVNVNGTLIVMDPRACFWSATNNICGNPGAPAAPNCLNAIQATGIDRIWDGARNHHGKRIWNPYDRGINEGIKLTVDGSTNQVMQWNHRDLTFDGNNLYADEESIDLAAAAGIDVTNAITYENEAVLGSHTTNDFTDTMNPALDEARHRGMKIIGYHGTQDPAILFRDDIDFYIRVAAHFGRGKLIGNGARNFDDLQDWYRLFLVPGAGHCPAVPQALPALMNWVENGVAPDSLIQNTLVPKLCPFPQKAIYNGSGSTADANSYTCDGDLQTKEVICNGLRTVYKHENGDELQGYGGEYNPDACKHILRELHERELHEK
jgi:hypothetical protein